MRQPMEWPYGNHDTVFLVDMRTGRSSILVAGSASARLCTLELEQSAGFQTPRSRLVRLMSLEARDPHINNQPDILGLNSLVLRIWSSLLVHALIWSASTFVET